MTTEKPSTPTKLCPTCGTRVSEDATRCLVCGSDLSGTEKSARAASTVQGSRMPEITLSLPAALGLLALFLSIGAVLVYFALRQTGQVAAEAPATVTPTVTVTPTPSMTPTEVPPTITATPLPSPTPMAYTVKLGDSCGTIAAQFGISIQSIILLNDLSATCGIFEGQKLQIPQPTPTATPLPTATLSPAEATIAACPKIEYTVQSSDTLSAISANYAVPMEAIREFNGLVSDTVRVGQKLVIPLCRRASTPGPTPTATLPPPYSAPQLLLPADGAAFPSAGEVITLQWSSVGTLREDESYQVILEDLTGGENRKVFDYLTDTKYIVPDDLRAADGSAHVYRWTVTTVRQTGTDDDGKPVWESAGATSPARVFVWSGSGAPPATQAP